ncbi:ATP-binding mismatch repair protein [Malassezia sp. CBS 17886]|nr:ATP-binding mismatch repair protein [Malassezia sp. CBS 17886]
MSPSRFPTTPPTLTPTAILSFNLDTVRARLLATRKPLPVEDDPHVSLAGAGVNVQDMDAAANALERVIHKTDFDAMQIIGQFNRGFIIARRRTQGRGGGPMDDLFIIDQHAADEMFNFERLQRTTQIHSQRLLRPQRVDLAPSDELVAAEHGDWLKLNGFEIRVNDGAAPGSRVELLSKPVSRDTVFDLHDLEELLYHLRESPVRSAYRRIRCTKARDMFASRACRKSIMIGSALDMRQMASVVQHMGEAEQPWSESAGADDADARTRSGEDMWRAVVQARETLDEARDCLFAVEEVRQALLASYEVSAPGRTSAQLRALDTAVHDLDVSDTKSAAYLRAAARAVGDGAEAQDMYAHLQAERSHVHTCVAALHEELKQDRVFVVLRDVCAQAHRLMDNLDAAMELALRPGAHGLRVLDTKTEYYRPAVLQVLRVLQHSGENARSDSAQAAIQHTRDRWQRMEQRLDDVRVAAATHALSTQLAVSERAANTAADTFRSKEKRPAESDDVAASAWRAPIGTPGKTPRTPTRQRPGITRLPSGVKTQPRAASTAGPSSARRLARERRASGIPAVSRWTGQLPPSPAWTAAEADAHSSPSVPLRAHSVLDVAGAPRTRGLYYRPPSSHPANVPVVRESRIPRLSMPHVAEPTPPATPSHVDSGTAPGAERTPRLRRAATHSSLRGGTQRPLSTVVRTPDGGSAQSAQRPSSSVDTRTANRARSTYVPNARDALDIGVARVCNERGIVVDRLDASGGAYDPSPYDQYNLYSLLTKPVACRLLHMHRPVDPKLVETRNVQVRVGGGWLELAQWLDARTVPCG